VGERDGYPAGTPCWVDVSTRDLDATKAFYTGLFGWEPSTDPRPEAGGYTMFRLRGKEVAAASPVRQGEAPPVWSTYIATDEVDATAAKIREAGGSIVVEPFDVLDAGRMAFASDPTGGVFGVWQAGRHKGAQLVNDPGRGTGASWRRGTSRPHATSTRPSSAGSPRS
jgi:uncharacterized protein